MRADEFLQLLFELEERHKADKDGGYGLVSSLVSEIRCLTSSEQELVRQYLIIIVALQVPKWWGIAVETIARMGCPEDAERLFHLMGYLPQASQDSVFGTLLTIAPASTASFVREYIQGAISRGNVSALTWLTRYYRMRQSPEVIRWLAETLVAFFSVSDLEERAIGTVQFLLSNLLEVDPNAVEMLAEETERVKPEFARLLKKVIIQQLRQPWFSRHVTPDVLERLIRRISVTDT